MKIIVFHGPENTAKHELLAWLRGQDVGADARTAGEMPANSKGSVDDRVDEAIAWADKAIALVTPDSRSPSGAPNVIDEIGRWRASRRKEDLAIVRDKSCDDIWSNLGGVVRSEYAVRVNESFLKLLGFMGLASLAHGTTLRAIPLREVLRDWTGMADGKGLPIFLVAGGCNKYDPARSKLGMKEYQSTEPVTGIVRVSRALSEAAGPRFIDAVCDYSPSVRSSDGPIDLIVVGGGDTNRVAKEILTQNVSALPVRFEPPTSSDIILANGTSWGAPDVGLVIAIENPLGKVRRAVLCAGNGAAGTNAALTLLASWLGHPGGQPAMASAGVVVQARPAGPPMIVWP